MNTADWILAGVIAVSTLMSIKRGFVKEALSLVTWLVAFIVARVFSVQLATFLADVIVQPSLRTGVAFGILFIATLIVGAMVNHLLGSVIKMTGLSGLDRLLGMAFGLVRGLVIAVVFTVVAGLTVVTEDEWWQESLLIPQFELIAEWSKSTFLDHSDELLDRSGELLDRTGELLD